MAEPHYTLYADQPLYRRVPWWVWALGLGALVVLVFRRSRDERELEDYLR